MMGEYGARLRFMLYLTGTLLLAFTWIAPSGWFSAQSEAARVAEIGTQRFANGPVQFIGLPAQPR